MDHRVQVGSKTRLLKHAIIYGANASGKSNLVDFFRFFKATLDGRDSFMGNVGIFVELIRKIEGRDKYI